MIEGLLLVTELVLVLLLLLAVKRASQPGARQDLGLFAYKSDPDQNSPPPLAETRKETGGGRA
jgi:hypothetical protein